MTSKNIPASPINVINNSVSPMPTHEGIGLRDWFAGQCDPTVYRPVETLCEKIKHTPTMEEVADYIAKLRLLEADAMMKARANSMTEPTPEDFFEAANALQDVASRDKPPVDVKAALDANQCFELLQDLNQYCYEDNDFLNSITEADMKDDDGLVTLDTLHVKLYIDFLRGKIRSPITQPEAAKVALDDMLKPDGSIEKTNQCNCIFKDDECLEACAYHYELEITNRSQVKKIDELCGELAKLHNENLRLSKTTLQTPASDGVQEPVNEALLQIAKNLQENINIILDVDPERMIESGFDPYIFTKFEAEIKRAEQKGQ